MKNVHVFFFLALRPPKSSRPWRGRRKRKGSRLALAAALLTGTLASMYAGAHLADFLLDLFGVASTPVRLGAKVLAVSAALPAGYYLVERFFLERSTRKPPLPIDTEQ